MKNDELIEALKYYDVKDVDYINKCKECLIFINSNKNILKQFHIYHNILFIDKKHKIRELWKYERLEDLFGKEVNPFITNILLLSGYKYHNKNMENYGFDDEQIIIHRNRVKEALLNDVIKRKYDGIRIAQMLWGAYFINCKLIEIGSLQFEYFDNKTVKIHIPENCRFDINIIKKSIEKSQKYMYKYFNIINFNYYCTSWLLSKQIHELLNKNSNIYKFYGLFDVTEGENCLDDILDYVYKKCKINDYNNLNAITSLQIRIKDYLINGNEIKIGIGKLKDKVK